MSLSSSTIVLPDELVKELLSPLFFVPDHLFRNTAYISPFAYTSESCCILLVVCKQWMRVATQLLYHDVILRSNAQAEALVYALTMNPDLGAHIRKLRVEGGFGQSMHKIILVSPNITDLFLTLDLRGLEDVSGLVEGLYSLNPTGVTLREGKNSTLDNKATKSLTKALCDCIKTWTTLKCFDFPYDSRHVSSSRAAAIADALSKSPSLDTLHISPLLCSIQYLRTIARNRNIHCIRVKPLPTRPEALAETMSIHQGGLPLDTNLAGIARYHSINYENDKKVIKVDGRLRSLVVFPEEDNASKFPSPPNTSYTPMQNATDDVKEAIWSRIISFAVGIEPPPVMISGCSVFGCNRKSQLHHLRLSVSAVSTQFRRLCEPYLFRDPLLSGCGAISSFSRLLSEKPWLSSHIRTLTFIPEIYGEDAISRSILIEAHDSLRTIISKATNLISLRQSSFDGYHGVDDYLSCDVLTVFPDATSNKVEELVGILLELPRDIADSGCFARFVNLRELRIECLSKATQLEGGELNLPPNFALPADTFPKLEVLAYAGPAPHDLKRTYSSNSPAIQPDQSDGLSLLGVLARVELPNIRELEVSRPFSDYDGYQAFLIKHGFKLTSVALCSTNEKLSPFQHCKNLTYFGVSLERLVGTPDMGFFSPTDTLVETLKKITIGDPTIGYKRQLGAKWEPFFENIDLSAFPSLKEVNIPSCYWPVNEHEIREGENPWVWRSDSLLRRCNVKLTDAQGRHWIPRLGEESAVETRKKKPSGRIKATATRGGRRRRY